uniref:UDP-glucuronosyltransferase 1-1 n=1 Tax=Anas zonorhyncha TaxID=75864 RepID=A0A8B9UYB5_9AVES
MKYTFDAVLMDPFFPCGQILAEHLSIPSVYLVRGLPCSLDFHATLCPNPPSYIPRFFTRYTDRMGFLQRVVNVIVSLSNSLTCSLFYSPYDILIKEFLQKEATLLEILSHASIWLMKYDFVFEYPRPVMPNMVLIGGISCTQEKPLSKVTIPSGFIFPSLALPNIFLWHRNFTPAFSCLCIKILLLLDSSDRSSSPSFI